MRHIFRPWSKRTRKFGRCFRKKLKKYQLVTEMRTLGNQIMPKFKFTLWLTRWSTSMMLMSLCQYMFGHWHKKETSSCSVLVPELHISTYMAKQKQKFGSSTLQASARSNLGMLYNIYCVFSLMSWYLLSNCIE